MKKYPIGTLLIVDGKDDDALTGVIIGYTIKKHYIVKWTRSIDEIRFYDTIDIASFVVG